MALLPIPISCCTSWKGVGHGSSDWVSVIHMVDLAWASVPGFALAQPWLLEALQNEWADQKYLSLFLKGLFLFERQIIEKNGAVRSYLCWPLPKWLQGLELGQFEAGNSEQLLVSRVGARAQDLWPWYPLSQAESWVRSGASWKWVGAHMGCQLCRQRTSLLHHLVGSFVS